MAGRVGSVVVFSLALTTACAGGGDGGAGDSTDAASAAEGGWLGDEGGREWGDAEVASGSGEAAAGSDDSAAPPSAPAPASGATSFDAGTPAVEPGSGLRAGSVDDNEAFAVTDRHVVTVAALLFGPLDGPIAASFLDGRAEVPADGNQHRIELDVRRPGGRPQLDVLFLIDATGSMGDDIERLKAKIDSVARRIGASPPSPTSGSA